MESLVQVGGRCLSWLVSRRRPSRIGKKVVKEAKYRGTYEGYKYLHFSMVVYGGKMSPIAPSSLAGGKHICGQRLCSSHAEMNALKFVKYDKLKEKKYCKKLTVVVVRFDLTEMSKGNFVLLDSKPCYHCLTALQRLGIDKVEYSCTNMETLAKSSVSTLLKTGDYVVSSGQRRKRKYNVTK